MKIPPEMYGLLGLLLAIGMGLFWVSIRSRFEEQKKEFLFYCNRDDGLKAHLIHLHRAGPGSMTTILSGDPNTKWMSRKKYRDAIKEAVESIGYSYEYEDEFEAIVIRRSIFMNSADIRKGSNPMPSFEKPPAPPSPPPIDGWTQ